MSVYERMSVLRLSVASPQHIRSWSFGEVTRPETIHSLTQKPVPGGLFCERIFGPCQDWTCSCGKYTYTHKRTPGFQCAICGVELTERRVRRERMGHIELCTPVAHPWFVEAIAALLNLSPRHLAAVLTYAAALVTQIDEEQYRRLLAQPAQAFSEPGDVIWLRSLTVGTMLDDTQVRTLTQRFPSLLRVERGAGAVHALLASLDLEALARSLRHSLSASSVQTRQHTLKRLHLVEAVRAAGINPAWMILSVLPVLPPDLRPLVSLDGSKYATSDINLLYARIIYRNNRLKRLLTVGAPDLILNHERRLLQEACTALFGNEQMAHPALGPTGKPLQSLAHRLQGKQGRFRQNLLGKRVDYSGRSVIVAGDPQLKLHQCGLPKSMCVELFQPFLIRKLLERNLAATVPAARRLLKPSPRLDPVVWDVLEEVLQGKVVLLNRAPTLHRLNIQAFEVLPMEGKTIRLHPLVCAAFNADFDGDQMAVHLPLSERAQAEARQLLLSTRNLRGPATGELSIALSQDIVLGLFYLTQDQPQERAASSPRHCFADANEAQLALAHQVITLHTPIVVRLSDACLYTEPGQRSALPHRRRVETTVGRLIFNETLPSSLRFRNYPMTKELLKQLLAECLQCCGSEATVHLADALKQLGFAYATRSGISFAFSDITVPPEKDTKLQQAEVDAAALEEQVALGMITEQERDRALISLWSQATEAISHSLESHLDPRGTLATILTSGATKAKLQQIRQLGGIRGLLANPAGEIIPIPIKGNYLEGLQPWEVFIAASGARKGFMDRSLNTARAGYLMRRLVEAGMDVWITMEDCGTQKAISIASDEEQEPDAPEMTRRLVGRVLSDEQAGLARGTLLTERLVAELCARGVRAVRVRSPLRCEAPYGLCQRCYGLDLASGELVRQGTAVGIIAAQSVGEPGTQLTMRTFHSGGIAQVQGDILAGLPHVEALFEARKPRLPALLAEISGTVHLEHGQDGGVRIRVREQRSALLAERSYDCPTSRGVLVKEGEQVTAGTPLTTGPICPHELLRVCGREAVGRYLVHEVHRIYRRQAGVVLNEKHLECLVRQMLRCLQIDDPGDTTLLPGTILDRFAVFSTNAAILAQGGAPAIAQPVLLGITKAALVTRSWLAAASFQETPRILTAAALRGQSDTLRGFKEHLIVGGLIPHCL
jgi:DNA-directed RNA polymerase subunit beta'